MEASGLGSFLRNRKSGSFFSPGSSKFFHQLPKEAMEVPLLMGENKHLNIDDDDDDDDDDGWLLVMISWIRIFACFVSLILTTFIWALIMVVLLPWPYQRIRQGNIYGQVTGKMVMWILGNPVKIEGSEYSNERAIYICNHASPIDIFLIMWLTPIGTVAIAKKEAPHLCCAVLRFDLLTVKCYKIIFYPLVGQIYVLANHLRIDRSNPASAIESMNKAADALVKHNLSLILFPEGTRSKNGRLLPFKKGFVHMALQTRLPIVPIIMTGTHRAWRKDSLHLRPEPLGVKYLPPIRTENWTENKNIDDYVNLVHDIYIDNLPESQRPGV